MRRSSEDHGRDDDIAALFDASSELNDVFSSMIGGYPTARTASPPRTPPRTRVTMYDEIPTAEVLNAPQSPMYAHYGSPTLVQSPQRAPGSPYGTHEHDAEGHVYRSLQDDLLNEMFRLNLSPGSPGSSFGVNLTPSQSPVYGGYSDHRIDSGRSLSASPAYGQHPSSPSTGSPKQQHSLYKTELCRSWEESGTCRYGSKCQFAHGRDELRPVLRHPKYKTEVCRTFAAQGSCPYGSRCRFIHYRAPEVEGTTVTHRTALSALMSGKSPNAHTADWSDTFLATPAPLDPRPATRAAAPPDSPDDSPISDETADISDAISDDQADDLDLRRLPIFASIAASPDRDIFDRR